MPDIPLNKKQIPMKRKNNSNVEKSLLKALTWSSTLKIFKANKSFLLNMRIKG
jgi:hypothetical protein